MATQAAEARTIPEMIEDAAIVTEALAREVFGDAAYLRRRVEVDRESGKRETVFEVHYCYGEPETDFQRLVELHQAFTRSFVRAMTPEVLSNVVLTAVPVDAD